MRVLGMDAPVTFADIDECGSNSYDCGNGTCVNILGSHVCTCPPGYVFNVDEQQCIGTVQRGLTKCSSYWLLV